MNTCHCVDCPLYQQGKDTKALPVFGKQESELLIVTDRPDSDQLYNNKRFSAYVGDFFLKHASRSGLPLKSAMYHPAAFCYFDKKRTPQTEQTKIITACSKNLKEFIKEVEPKLIIALGSNAIKAAKPRTLKISDANHFLSHLKDYDTYLLGTNNPAEVKIDNQKMTGFQVDFDMAARMFETPNFTTIHRDTLYPVLTDLTEILARDDITHCAYDIEAIGLDPFKDIARILTIQIAFSPDEVYVIPWDHPESKTTVKQKQKLTKDLETLLVHRDIKVFGHNMKFDALWTLVHLNFRIPFSDCTQEMARALDENNLVSLGLCINRYVPSMANYDKPFNDGVADKGRLDLEPLDDINLYGGGDAEATFRLYECLMELISPQKGVYNNYKKIVVGALNMFVIPELVGMDINEKRLDDFDVVLERDVQQLHSTICSMIPKTIKRKYINIYLRDKKGDYSGLNLLDALDFGKNKKGLLMDYLFYHPDGLGLSPMAYTGKSEYTDNPIPSMGKDHYEMLDSENDEPVLTLLAEYATMSKMKSNYSNAWRKHIANGKVHPKYDTGAVTGRTRSRDPNAQSISKHHERGKAFRRAIVPPPGYAMLEADYSQAELRLIAHVSNCRPLIQIYRDGGDVHAATVRDVIGVKDLFDRPEDEIKHLRQQGKATNFGLMYGQEEKNFIASSLVQYGVTFTPEQANKIRRMYFQQYPGLREWQESTKRTILETGQIRAVTGKIRRLPNAFSQDKWMRLRACRQGINAHIQEPASSFGLLAMAKIESEIDPRILRPFSFVHDAIYLLVKEEYVDWGARTVKWYMENVPLYDLFGVNLSVPIVADVEFSLDNLGEMYELKGLEIDKPYDFSKIDFSKSFRPEKYENMKEQSIPLDLGRRSSSRPVNYADFIAA